MVSRINVSGPARIVGVLCVLAGLFSGVAATDYRHSRVLAEGQALLFDTADGTADGRLSRFSLPTAFGELSGRVTQTPQLLRMSVALHSEQAELVIGPVEPAGADVPLSIAFAGIGSLELRAPLGEGVPTVVSHDIADCAGLADSPLYRALSEALLSAGRTAARLDPDFLDPGDASLIAVHTLLEKLVYGPTLVQLCEAYLTDPWTAQCVVMIGFEECVGCCEGQEKFSSVIRDVCRLTGLFWRHPIILSCGWKFARSSCRTRQCEGKPGDPSPTICGDPSCDAVCMFACPKQNAIPGDCPPDLACCPRVYCDPTSPF